MSILAIIPARSGSKRLANKNILSFCRKPLLAWAVEQALRINEIDAVALTTDYTQAELLDNGVTVGRGMKLLPVIQRPPYLADDGAPMAHVIAHALGRIPVWPSLVVLLQPTSPTRTDETVRECIEIAKEYGGIYTTSGEPIRPDFQDGVHLKPNGACYAFRPDRLPPLEPMHTPRYFTDDVDVDTLEDFERAEKIMKERLIKEGR